MKPKRTLFFSSLKMLTQAAMLTALSVIIGIFCKNFLNFSNGLFRITFENLPILLSGILFGPAVGGIVGIATDLISYLLSNQVYPPNLVVTAGAFSIGFLSGLLAKYVIRKKGFLQIIVSCAVAHAVGSMLIKTVGLYQYYGILVLWRIPLYLVIAPIEIFILCQLLRNKNMQRLMDYHF